MLTRRLYSRMVMVVVVFWTAAFNLPNTQVRLAIENASIAGELWGTRVHYSVLMERSAEGWQVVGRF